ncbi:FAD dependent oxidoreductase [Gonapodya prolifera JEL478]|uniref:FAD dependent oxidoreductase n=1 Tax=Gonapodya prolifera (strain JEL478) TaxID=1344416 RepID=A0A139AK67_GONPJ|nr:FAD dependent oxidoreductase [Gonapodya prolifera JEL478]|eukprot:KXS17182.1 FAD dependent oxidoreductase [Gonapodya prolifera JEL478]
MRVIVVGAGVFGLSAASALRSEGHDVVVLERSAVIPAEDASSTDISKVVRLDYGQDRLYARLAKQAIDKFRQWNAEDARKGKLPVYQETGVLALATKKLEQTEFERNSLMGIKELGLLDRVERLSRTPTPGDGQLFELGTQFPSKPIESLFPAWGDSPAVSKYVDGYLNKFGGYALASKVVERMAESAREMGVKFVCGRSGTLTKLVRAASGKVTGVETIDGKVHHGDLVIMACGAWTPILVPELDGKLVSTGQSVLHFQLPQHLVPKYSADKFPVWFADISTTGFYGFPVNPTTPNLLKISNHGPGCVNLATPPGSPHRSVSVPKTSVTDKDLTIPAKTLQEYRAFIDTTFPDLAELPVYETRLCWYTDAWDGHFYIDYVPGYGDSLMVATGGSGHGFKFAPVLSTIIADTFHRRSTPYTNLFRWRERPDTASRVLESTRGEHSLVSPLVLGKTEMASKKDLEGRKKEKL